MRSFSPAFLKKSASFLHPVLGRLFWSVILLLAPVPQGSAADLDFFKDIHPFLQPNCIPCHNKTTTKAKLNLETPELIKKGGESGPGLVPGKAADSLMVQSAAHQGDSAMPPKDNKSGAVDLTPAQLALLSSWINQGAKTSVKRVETVALHALPKGVQPIYSVAMTPDGRTAACGRGGELFLYDLATRQALAPLKDPALKSGAAHEEIVHSLHFSPDGNRLASGGFREVKIWRREQGAPSFQTIPGIPPNLTGVLSPDGSQLLVWNAADGLRLLEASTGALIRLLPEAPKTGVKALSVSPDGASCAVCTEDGAWTLWSLADGQKRPESGALPGATALSWTPDGKSLVFCLADGVRVWSLPEAKVLREIKVPNPRASSVSGNGSLLAVACGDCAVHLFDFASGKPVLEMRGSKKSEQSLAKLEWEVASAGLDAAHHASLTARIDVQNKLFDIQVKKAQEAIATAKKELPDKKKAVFPAQKAREEAEKALDEATAAVAAAPEGKPDAAAIAKKKEATTKLATAVAAANSAAAAVISAENHVKDGEEQLQNIAASRETNAANRTQAEADQERAKKVQSVAQAALDGLKAAKPKNEIQLLAVAFSKDNHSVAAIYSDGRQQVWSTSSGDALGTLHYGAPLVSASVVPLSESRFLSLGSDGRLAKTAHPDQWKLERTLGGTDSGSPFVDRVSAVRFSPDGLMLATGGGESSRSGDVHLWETLSGKLLQTWKDKHNDTVLALDFSPDGLWLASGGADRMGRVTEVATAKPLYLLEAHTHHVMGVAFRADGRILATAGADGVVNTWDMSSGERAKKIIGWNKEVTSLQFLGASSKIVTSAADNQVRIVNDDGTEVRSMAKLPDFVQAAAGAKTSPLIIGGGEDSILRLWNGSTGAELTQFTAP
ncbi:MAG: WD40 repeat [Verrucomicrobia bacterium]|nr:MAG: WD40 repeat [Verrucomicrobiota bacterium]